ncbi:putative phage holin [Streptosporangium canum]|uniref:putative phage holin n=1 Tax=Streptosporangium canum TaxID=324952 RepID=UPI0033BBB7E5
MAEGDLVHLIGSLLVVVTALLAIACVAAQVLLARWWETSAGRHVFAFQAVLAACLSLWAVRLLFPAGDWFQIPRLVAFALVPWVLAWRFLIIVQTWRTRRRQREEHR